MCVISYFAMSMLKSVCQNAHITTMSLSLLDCSRVCLICLVVPLATGKGDCRSFDECSRRVLSVSWNTPGHLTPGAVGFVLMEEGIGSLHFILRF